MLNFIKRILVEEGFSPEFFFNPIYTVNGVSYHVSVLDKNKQSVFFTMQEKNSSWKILNAPKPPEWVLGVEQKLGDAIQESSLGTNIK